MYSAFHTAASKSAQLAVVEVILAQYVEREREREIDREREREIRLLAVAEDNTIIYNNKMPLLMGWMVNDTLHHPKTH